MTRQGLPARLLPQAEPARRWPRRQQAIGLGLAATLCVACTSGSDIVVGYSRGSIDGGRAGAAATAGAAGVNPISHLASAGADGANPSANAGTAGAASVGALDYCANGGPVIELPAPEGCTSALAKRAFSYALCTCSDLRATGAITTTVLDALASTEPVAGASIGVNGRYQALDVGARVGGSLVVRGNVAFGHHDIAGSLRCAGSLTVTSESRVHQDAYVMGEINAPTLTIDGTLRMQENWAANVLAAQGGVEKLNEMFLVPPCDCSNQPNIAAIVAHFANNNDNARQSLASSMLAANDGDFALTLPCGRYYFDSIGGTGAITLHLTGRTAIIVGGGVSNSGGLTVDLAPDAELDLFVGASVVLTGPAVLGQQSRPAATRIYIGGKVSFSSKTSLYANWYVPNDSVATSAQSEFWGALYALSLEVDGSLSVHYDRAILSLPSCATASPYL